VATPPPPASGPCPTSLQAAVNAAPSGSTLNVTGCTFRESVTIGKAMVLRGGTIDGQGSRFGLRVRASDVTIDGTTIANTVEGSIYEGGLDVRGVTRTTIMGTRVLSTSGACVYIEGGSASVSGSDFGPCGVTGLHLQRSNGTTIRDSRLHDTNTRRLEPGNESGGMKAVESTGVVVTRVESDHNYGPGIWFDGRANDATVQDSRVHDNSRPGIFFEISTGATITGNRVWNNGWGFSAWAWGAGILISSSGDAVVANNLVAWNADGISIISQGRSDRAPTTGIMINDNEIFSSDNSSDTARFGVGWVEDWSGSLFSSASGNSGTNNRYWYPSAEGTITRFAWNGALSRIAAFQATPGDSPGRYLTAAEKDSFLSAAGMPTQP
jgi:parallel beta-helix repeat protein